MQFSHSRIECFRTCRYKFKLHYLEGLETIRSDAKADDALILGHALHTGIEKGVEAGIQEYLMAYPIITDEHITEQIKLEYWIPKVRAALPNGQNEVLVADRDFHGFIDYLAPVTMFHDSEVPNLFDIYDFKYTSNSGQRYLESDQLHLYKYYFERQTGQKIRNMTYILIPKLNIKQRKDETILEYRTRVASELEKQELKFLPVEYDPNQIIDFFRSIKGVLEETEFPKDENYLCGWCEYQDYCKKGYDFMLLPENKRRSLTTLNKKVVWLYGAPFSGKTFFANAFPDPLMLNTDGNVRFVDAPYIPIKDKVEVNGRLTKKTLAWDVFKEVIAELEKKQNDFRTIVVDLLEDTYEACRLYMYEQMGITHESDDAFRAWDKVRTEFLSTIRRLTNLDYENIVLISHEDTSRDITKKSGDRITGIKPNIQDKVANKVSGMVDIVARIIADGDTRTLSFKTNEVIFGGGRLTVTEKEIPLDYDAFVEVYNEANKNASKALEVAVTPVQKKVEENPKPEDEPVEKADEPPFDTTPEEPLKKVSEETPDTVAEPPKPRSRRRRTEQ